MKIELYGWGCKNEQRGYSLGFNYVHKWDKRELGIGLIFWLIVFKFRS